MNRDQTEQLTQLDQIIEASEHLKGLVNSEGFKLFLDTLIHLRTAALQDILAAEKDSDATLRTRIGHAQAINAIINSISDIRAKADYAQDQKLALLNQIRLDEQISKEREESMRLSGYDFGGAL